jgi:hypothetical protein
MLRYSLISSMISSIGFLSATIMNPVLLYRGFFSAGWMTLFRLH